MHVGARPTSRQLVVNLRVGNNRTITGSHTSNRGSSRLEGPLLSNNLVRVRSVRRQASVRHGSAGRGDYLRRTSSISTSHLIGNAGGASSGRSVPGNLHRSTISYRANTRGNTRSSGGSASGPNFGASVDSKGVLAVNVSGELTTRNSYLRARPVTVSILHRFNNVVVLTIRQAGGERRVHRTRTVVDNHVAFRATTKTNRGTTITGPNVGDVLAVGFHTETNHVGNVVLRVLERPVVRGRRADASVAVCGRCSVEVVKLVTGVNRGRTIIPRQGEDLRQVIRSAVLVGQGLTVTLSVMVINENTSLRGRQEATP